MRVAPWTSSSWTRRPTTASTTCASCCPGSTPPPRTCAARCSSSTRSSASRRAGTSCSRRWRSRPDGVVFVFCTTDPSQIRPAVVSRLQRFTFRPLSLEDITGKLTRILAAEGRSVDAEAIGAHRAAWPRVACATRSRCSTRCWPAPRTPSPRRSSRSCSGSPQLEAVDRFVDALAGGDALAGIAVLDALEGEGRDLVAFSEQVVTRIRERLVAALRERGGPEAPGPGGCGAATHRHRCQPQRPGRLPVAARAGAAVRRRPVGRQPPGPPPHRHPTGPTAAAEAVRPPSVQAPPAGRPQAVAPPAPDARERGRAIAACRACSRAGTTRHRPAGRTRRLAIRPAPARPAGHASADPLFDQVVQHWPQIVAHVGRNPANRPIVTACRPVEVRDGIVVLGFPENQAFLRDHAEREEGGARGGHRGRPRPPRRGTLRRGEPGDRGAGPRAGG